MGEKVYIIGTGHMTEMAPMLIYGKNLQKSNCPRYQVSVYRTIGPLFSFYFSFMKSFVFEQKVLFRVAFLSVTSDYRVQCPRVG